MSGRAKWILGILGALALGALGSGAWEHIIEPLLGWVIRGLLEVGTLGIERYKDGVYRDIARENVEGISLLVLAYMLFFFGIVTGTMVALLGTVRLADSEKAEAVFSSLLETSPSPKTKRRIRYLYRFGVVLLIFLVGWLLVSNARAEYVNKARVHYHQLLNIVAPVIGPEERLASRSAFARVGSREDYVRVLEPLEEVARANNLWVPRMDVW